MTLGVAIIGAGANQWSGIAHIPAIEAADDLRLVRLVTSNPDSARRATDRWQVPAGSDLDEALNDPAVDLVAITVRVPLHAEIAEAAIRAGKHVYCEWPLAVDAERARQLARLSAANPDRMHVVGLQGRCSPGLRAAAELVAAGRIGDPITASVRVLLSQALLARPRHREHLRLRSSAANVLTIQGGHTLDMLAAVLGPPGPVNAANLWTGAGEFTVAETGERLKRDAPDNLAVMMDMGGVPIVAQLSQTSAQTAIDMTILGTKGALTLSSADQPQMSRLDVAFTGLGAETDPVMPHDDGAETTLPLSHPGHNLAVAYRRLAAAVHGTESQPLPTFAHAVSVHQLLESITQRAST